MKQSSLSMYAEDALKNFGIFLEEHDEKLRNLKKQTFKDSSVSLTSIAPVITINYDDMEIVPAKHTESELYINNKSLTTLANLCNQCHDLTKSAEQFQLKFLFTDAHIDDVQLIQGCSANIANECVLLRMSSAIDFFCQVYFLLKRIIVVLQAVWHQVAASLAVSTDFNEVHVISVFDAMVELLEHLVVFNEIAEQSSFTANWTLYKKWLQKLAKSSADGSEYCSHFELNGLHTSLDDIERVISGNIFRIFLDSIVELKKQFQLKDINNITQHSNAYLRKKLLDIDAHQTNEYRNYEEPKHVVRLTAFIAVLYELGIQIDGKLIKSIIELLSKHQRLSLHKNVYWSPNSFLSKHAKSFVKLHDRALMENPKPHHTSWERCHLMDQRSCRQLGTQIALWSINMQRAFASDVLDNLRTFSKLIVTGQRLTDRVNGLIDGSINRHMALNMPMTSGSLAIVCKLMQYLKILQQTFANHHVAIMRILSSLIQWQKQKILHLLSSTKRKILDLKLLQRKMNTLSMLKVAEKSLKCHQQNTRRRLMIVNLAFSELIEKDRFLPADQQKQLKSILLRAQSVCNFEKNILGQFDDLNLIYSYWSLLSARTKELVDEQGNAYALQNILAATNQLDKSIAVFKCCDKAKPKSYNVLIESLSTNLEMFLRVEALAHLFLSHAQPFEQFATDYRSCLNVSPTEIDGDYTILRDELENYFTATFYNLTTIAPHDWKSYEKMRHFAYKLFALRPVDDYLPNQIIDQGIDVLQIMRNIHTFASSYSYNMNLQLFVENYNKGKHLDIIGTRHVANSVQTHGTGIINTTVNFIYQFLRQKFYTFSTFLHDEHIKSRLLKEFRFYSEHKQTKLYQSYPYDRADSFIKKIRKLGASNNGETYMDLFRKVITHVGNAVGYVRLLQSGSKNANYRSRSYMSKIVSNLNRSESKHLDGTTEAAISEYEKSIGHMKESYSDSTNYFKLLMQGFQPFLCNPHNHHLKTFFLITPALIMNYIDYRVKQRKIYKKDQPKCSLFDDGFAIGLIYILNMLNQLNEFHELAWRTTISEQLKTQRLKIKDILATQSRPNVNDNENEKVLQTVAITERHINAYDNEYSLLYASLGSAEIFFQ